MTDVVPNAQFDPVWYVALQPVYQAQLTPCVGINFQRARKSTTPSMGRLGLFSSHCSQSFSFLCWPLWSFLVYPPNNFYTHQVNYEM